jgi:hypothetical protein
MNTYQYEIGIPATSKEEAVTKIKAVAVIVSNLNTKELSKLADIIANDPVKTALAKKALGV